MGVLLRHLPDPCLRSCDILVQSYEQKTKMADLMWGGVPFTIPSLTAMKYISGAVKVQLIGHRQSRRDMVESYEIYDRLHRSARSEPRSRDSVRPSLALGDSSSDYKTAIRRYKPGSGLGATQPRMEHVIGCVDRRKTLPGYI